MQLPIAVQIALSESDRRFDALLSALQLDRASLARLADRLHRARPARVTTPRARRSRHG